MTAQVPRPCSCAFWQLVLPFLTTLHCQCFCYLYSILSDGANRGLSKSTAVKIESKSESNGKKKCFLVIKFLLGLLLFGLVLICTVLSKVTLISLTDKLRNVTVAAVNRTLKNTDSRYHDIAVSLYWQLLLVVLVPNVIAWVRSLVYGVLGKTTINFPWPTMMATFLVSVSACLCT